MRTVDEPQYVNRLRTWDFDVIIYAWGDTLLPGNELRDYWSAEAADQPGSDNIIGIKNPAVDAMIERIILAKNRGDLVTAAQSARPHPVVEPFRRAAVELQQAAHRALGSLQPSRTVAEIRHRCISNSVVVGCR